MLYLLHQRFGADLDGWLIYAPFGLLDQLEFRALAAATLAFFVVIALGKRTIRFLIGLKIGDSGLADAEILRAHSASKANTPTMGGVLLAAAIATATLLLADVQQMYVVLALVVLVWLAAVGGADDWLKLTASRRGAGSRQGLHAWEKLVFQLGLGLVVGLFIFRAGDTELARDVAHAMNVPLQNTYVPGTGEANPSLLYLPQWLFILIATLMIAGMSNAVNITDGMDGLAAGTGASVSLGVGVLSLIAGTQATAQHLLVPHVTYASELAVVSGAMFGACLGFLWFNCAPAQVFMGDTGSLALGGLVGYIAIVTRQEIVVLMMSGVFLLEIASVMLQVGFFKYTRLRTGTGRRIFRIAPYHHHLHMGGWTESQVVARLWIVSVLLVLLALATIKIR